MLRGAIMFMVVALIGGGPAHAAVDLRQQGVAGAGSLEVRERRVDLAAVRVGVEVAEAGRNAASHLPVGGRMLTQLQGAAAPRPTDQTGLPPVGEDISR